MKNKGMKRKWINEKMVAAGVMGCAMLLLTGCKQSATTTTTEPLVAASILDVEKLKDSLDYNMDISQLSVSDLRILRNAAAARRGYPFKDSYLRGVYQTTTWYDSLMWNFDGTQLDDDYMENRYDRNLSWRENYYRAIKKDALAFTQQELDFIQRVRTRENELLQQNFKAPDGGLVHVANLVNPGLLKTFDPDLQRQLGRNGFAIVPASHQQLFHVYEQNDYHEFPSFVTTDLYLQLYHLYFDSMLREVEQQKLAPMLTSFCDVGRHIVAGSDSVHQWLQTFFDVPLALLRGVEPVSEPARTEYRRVMKSENDFSAFLGYENAMFEYSLFRPRGHYTRNDTLGRYFRAMMWLQTVPFQTDRRTDMMRATTLARAIGQDPSLSILYEKLTGPMTFLMGEPDDVSLLQVWQLMQDEQDFDRLCQQVDQLADRQTRLRPKFLRTGRNKLRLMPQRYQPDAEVLQEMVDYEGTPTQRGVPSGLDVMAAMGNSKAERILLDEQQEADRWKQYKPTLDRMKQRMDSVDWSENVATFWMSTLQLLTDSVPEASPYFMLTSQWDKKQLNAALASWAELKHDAILYAKQPMGAECGGGGPPNPVVKGYVEPNVAFWKKSIELLDQTSKCFERYGLMTPRTKNITLCMKEQARFLLAMSEKELEGKVLADEEYDQLKYIGATFENISVELIRNPEQRLYEWNAVQGPERNVALIADVYTANTDNNPQKSILYAGVGQADELYVVVEVQGYLYLMRGSVLSYRELTRPYGEQRMNDEEWQQQLEQQPRLGVPEWMKEITVPVKEAPVDNDAVFYSTGC